MFPVSEEALSETAESTSDEVVMDVLAETEETVLTGTEDAAPVQADNKTVTAEAAAQLARRVESARWRFVHPSSLRRRTALFFHKHSLWFSI